jgi:hypothetical protein
MWLLARRTVSPLLAVGVCRLNVAAGAEDSLSSAGLHCHSMQARISKEASGSGKAQEALSSMQAELDALQKEHAKVKVSHLFSVCRLLG